MSSELHHSDQAFRSQLHMEGGRFGLSWRAYQATRSSGRVPQHPSLWPAQVCEVLLRAAVDDTDRADWGPQKRIMEAGSQYTTTMAAMAIGDPWRLNMGHLSLSLILGHIGPVRSDAIVSRTIPTPKPRLPALMDTMDVRQMQGMMSNVYDLVSPKGISLMATFWGVGMALGIDKALSTSHARLGEAAFHKVKLHTGQVLSAALLVLRDPAQRG